MTEMARLTGARVVAEPTCFALADNQRELVSYAGQEVVQNQSDQRAQPPPKKVAPPEAGLHKMSNRRTCHQELSFRYTKGNEK